MVYCLTLEDTELLGTSPTTIVEVGDTRINAIIDTGATANFISYIFYNNLIKFNKIIDYKTLHKPLMVNVANGKPLWVKEMLSFKCLVDSEEVTLNAFIAPWLQTECILGVPFIQQYKEIAIPAISHEVKMLTPKEYFKLISATEARREMSKSTTQAQLFWISTNDQVSDISTDLNTQNILKEFSNIIVDKLPDVPPTERTIKHTIEVLPGTAPVARRPYRMSASDKRELERQLNELLESRRIEAKSSPFAAPVLFVTKKDGTKRLCCDFRGLNDVTVKNKYPLPRIDDLFDMLAGASTFSQLDLVSGYHQVEVAEEDQYKTAFVTHEGQYVWKVMPFGLTNAPSTFQMLMNETLKGLIGKIVLVYLDDILVFSKSVNEHKEHLKLVLTRIKDQGLFVKKSKSFFFKQSVNFLGHTISAKGLQVDKSKVQAVVDWPTPQTSKDALAFLGTCSFYRKFVPGFSKIADCIFQFAHKKRSWDKECEEAFNLLKEKLTTAPVLLPFDETKDVLVTTDASNYAVGATLELLDDSGKVLGVVAYSSHKLSGSQLNWDVREKEGYAIRVALGQWAHYLKGKHFTLHTDHHSLQYLYSKRTESPKIERWLDLFSTFDFSIEYIKGEKNRADGLSRIRETKNFQNFENANNNKQNDDDKIKEIEEYTTPPSASLWSITANDLSPTNIINKICCTISPEYKQTIISGYHDDPEFQQIYKILTENHEIPHELSTIIKRYAIRDKLLYYGFTPLNRNKLCIPNNSVRKELLALAHDSIASSHCDSFRTRINLSPYYHWPRMQKSIDDYVKVCTTCQKSKHRTGKQYGTYTPLDVPDDRWRDINIDFITGMTPDKKTQHDMIMVVVDRFSKMAHFISCKKTDTSEVIMQLFLKEVFRLHGVPRTIVSDRDKLFTSSLWDRFTQRLGIKLHMTTSHNPQADGQVERVNKILTEKVIAATKESGDNWVELLPMVEFAYNNTYQSTIQATPFLAAHTFHPRFVGMWNPLESSKLHPSGSDRALNDQSKVLEQLIERSEAIRWIISERIAKEQERISIKQNKKMKKADFKINQQVLIHNSVFKAQGKGSKFNFLWYGPFTIIEVRDGNTVRVALNDSTGKHDVFNVKDLRHFTPNLNDYGRVSPVSEEEIQSRLHQINGFEQMRYISDEVEVEVTWQDCEKWDTTWLPLSLVEKHLPHSQIEYFKRHRKNVQDTFNKWVIKKKKELMSKRKGRNNLYPYRKPSRRRRTKKW